MVQFSVLNEKCLARTIYSCKLYEGQGNMTSWKTEIWFWKSYPQLDFFSRPPSSHPAPSPPCKIDQWKHHQKPHTKNLHFQGCFGVVGLGIWFFLHPHPHPFGGEGGQKEKKKRKHIWFPPQKSWNTLWKWQNNTWNLAELFSSTLVHDLTRVLLDYYKRMSKSFHILSDNTFIMNDIATDGDISVYDHI